MEKQLKNGNFVHKLEKLLNNHLYQHIITWDHSKTYIDILDPGLMQTQITPKFFRHSKFQSFVRQLNLYGFRKIKGQAHLRFTHPLLLNGQSLSAVTNYKCSKASKPMRQPSLSLEDELPAAQEDARLQVPRISMEKQAEEGRNQGKIDTSGSLSGNGDRELVGNSVYNPLLMQNQYLYWWSMMSMMGGHPMPVFNFNQGAFCQSQ